MTQTTEATKPPEESQEEKQRRLERRSRLLGGLIYYVVRLLLRTCRLTVLNEAVLTQVTTGAILVTWHGRTLIPASCFRKRGYWALISLSRDGELQNNIFQRFGFHTIRGSTGKGGVRGALQMARRVKDGGILAFTPDGPRGPTHKVQPGVLLMAEKSGAPIIPVGSSASRRWLIKSWDSYMIPKPFSRIYLLYGDPISVSSPQDEAGREQIAEQVEFAINRIEQEAERLAGFTEYPVEWRIE